MTEEREPTDEERLAFMANALREAGVHIAIRNEKNIVQMYTRPSDWAQLSVPSPEKFDLDDLRLIIDQAIAQAKEND